MKIRFFKVLLFLLPMLSLVCYGLVLSYILPHGEHSSTPTSEQVMNYLVLCAGLLIIAMVSSLAAYYMVVARSSLSEKAKNISLSATTLLVILIASECYCLLHIESNGIGYRISSYLWDKKYIRRRTPFKYIDSHGIVREAEFREPITSTYPAKKKVWFIGDSFTFGFGLEHTALTFPAIVEKLCDRTIKAINLGSGGATTRGEAEILSAYAKLDTAMPAAIVWQYFGNDIDEFDLGPDQYERQLNKSKIVQWGRKWLMGRSMLLDHIYWQYLVANERGTINSYVDFLSDLYRADSHLVKGVTVRASIGNLISPYEAHLLPLKETAKKYQAMGVPFVVVIFPFLWQGGPEDADTLYARRIAKDMNEIDVDAINLSPLVVGIPADDRVVNNHDLHPSALVNRLVADTISKYLKARGI